MLRKFQFLVSLIFIGLFVSTSYCQFPGPSPTPTYTMTLANDDVISPTEYQCDIFITRTSTSPFELSLCQIGLTYNNAVKGTGTMTASWVAGSNDPAIVAAGQTPTLVLATNVAGYIKMAGHLASGGIGTGTKIPTSPIKVGRLKLVNTVPFLNTVDFSLNWSFAGSYITKIFAYDPDDSKSYEITTPATHLDSLDGPLPVELTNFGSKVNGRQVNLNWETKTEANSDRYEIERALASTKDEIVTWVSVGNIKAAGSSISVLKYSYTDKNLQTGKYQYRLKMIDFNGSVRYSSIVETEIAVPKEFSVSQNYPNPFNPSTTIAYQIPVDAKVIIDIYNITGQRVSELVNQDLSAGYYTANFGASKLSSGIYIYRLVAVDKVSGNNFSSIKKMMLLK
jgi:hypothetical protein